MCILISRPEQGSFQGVKLHSLLIFDNDNELPVTINPRIHTYTKTYNSIKI